MSYTRTRLRNSQEITGLSFLRVARSPTEDPYVPQQRRPFVTERADGAQVEDFQGWNHGRTPSSSSATVRAVTRS
jgi:hypothetical protein